VRPLRRLLAGALALAAAGGAAAATSGSSAAAPAGTIAALSSAPAARHCRVTLPGGLGATVTDTAGQESAQVTTSTTATGGVFAFDSGGDRIVLPMSALRDPAKVDLAGYDTALLAQRGCGLPAPSAHRPQPGGGYTLGRLTVHTVDGTGHDAAGLVLLTNVDTDAEVRTPLVTDGSGLAKIAVPVGHYAALYASPAISGDATFTVLPEFTVTDGTSVTLDQRTATESIPTPTTPQAADLGATALDLSRGGGTGDGTLYGYWANYLNLGSNTVSLKITPQRTPVAHGHFTVNPSFDYTSPAGAAQPYSYHVTEPFENVPAAFPTRVDPRTLATVTRGYGAPGSPGLAVTAVAGEPAWEARTRVFGVRGVEFVPTGADRTEYFSAGPGIVWQTLLQDTSWDTELIDSEASYQPGRTTREDFNTGGQHPAALLDPTGTTVVCAACSTGTDVQLDIQPLGDNTPGHPAVDAGLLAPDTAAYAVSLSRNGTVLASGQTDPQSIAIDVPKGKATYQLSTSYQRTVASAPLSTSGQTTWTFTADPGHGAELPGDWYCADGSTACAQLPLLFADTTADADLLNRLTPGAHQLSLGLYRQGGATAPVTGAATSISYDDGQTWQPLRTTAVPGSGNAFRAGFTVPAGASGFLSIRVSAWDRAGDRIDQTVTRAYEVG
jgi:hypothetical protein